MPAREEDTSLLEQAETVKRVWEIAVWLVEAGVVIVGIINANGGPVHFLVEVGLFGIGCYLALFAVVPITVYALSALEKAANRTTTDTAVGVIVAVALLAGGALIRSLFYPGFADDLDAIGTGFAALLGIGVLAIPLVYLWYSRGSRPAGQ